VEDQRTITAAEDDQKTITAADGVSTSNPDSDNPFRAYRNHSDVNADHFV
jgi:hypothetical protein